MELVKSDSFYGFYCFPSLPMLMLAFVKLPIFSNQYIQKCNSCIIDLTYHKYLQHPPSSWISTTYFSVGHL